MLEIKMKSEYRNVYFISTCDEQRLTMLQGNEPFPVLSHGSERGTGFTHEKAKPLYVNRVMGDVSHV